MSSEEGRVGHRPIRATVAVVTLAIGVGALVAGCSNAPSASPTHRRPVITPAPTTTTTTTASPTSLQTIASTTTTSAAPCTVSAIAAAAGSAYTVVGFACTGDWAYADVEANQGNHSYTAVMVLSASGGTWQRATRAAACNTRKIAPGLYTRACTTS